MAQMGLVVSPGWSVRRDHSSVFTNSENRNKALSSRRPGRSRWGGSGTLWKRRQALRLIPFPAADFQALSPRQHTPENARRPRPDSRLLLVEPINVEGSCQVPRWRCVRTPDPASDRVDGGV